VKKKTFPEFLFFSFPQGISDVFQCTSAISLAVIEMEFQCHSRAPTFQRRLAVCGRDDWELIYFHNFLFLFGLSSSFAILLVKAVLSAASAHIEIEGLDVNRTLSAMRSQ